MLKKGNQSVGFGWMMRCKKGFKNFKCLRSILTEAGGMNRKVCESDESKARS